MKKLWFLLIASTLLVWGCKDSSTNSEEETHHHEHGFQTLNIRFYPTWNGEEFKMNTNYNTDNDVVKFTKAKFYLSEVSLIDSNGNAYPADLASDGSITIGSKIKLVDFSNLNEEGYVEVSFLTDAEPGNYRGIRFSVGVPTDENSNDVSTQTEPLGPNSGMFWSWNSGYVFHALEGKFDSAGTATSFLYHQGTNNMKSVIDLHSLIGIVTEFELEHNTATAFSVNLDYSKVFKTGLNTSNAVNLKVNKNERSSHGGPMALQVCLNLRSAFTRKN